MPLISAENLCLSYDEREVLKNLSFNIYKGDYVVILGENGAGKSTLIKALSGIKEINLGEIKYSYNKADAGYLPQYVQTERNFPATVYEVVRSGLLNKKGFLSFYTKEDKKTAELNIKKMELEDIKERPFAELSGGQKQRVLLARALCSSGKIIFLDEPVAGLDIKSAKAMYDIIEKINREELMTVVMVSHDVLTAVKYANKIIHIGENEIFFGTTEEYLKTGYYKNIRGVLDK